MASASTSSVEKRYMYDVFISFRGKDLRTSFVDHLFEDFRRHGIIVFKDDKDIEVGEKIRDELPKAIKDSKFHIVIFSQKYADSSWCLNELVDILEIGQNPALYPIFYHVKPSEVREQKGPVGEAFSVHSENEAAGRWRDAMAEAASLEGWELTNTGDGHEVPFIKKIVDAISKKPYFAKFSDNRNLVGMTTRVEKLLSSLQVGFDDVRMIGITGMGGVGKTTLARVVFNRIANQFDGKSFVENVRERSKDPRGFRDMQQQLLTSVFGDQSIYVPSDSEGRNMMKMRMPNIKVVVVLDDVNDVNQLEALAEPSWFRPGSRIIITSRDRQVLVAHGVHNMHDVGMLSDEEAIRLLSRIAFSTESPAQGYEELSRALIRYAHGLPLTIVTTSASLRDCPIHVWKDAIKRLEKIPWSDTMKILKISYDALNKDQKEIFLNACNLKGQTKKKAIKILERAGLHAEYGLEVLEQKSLITFRDGHTDIGTYPFVYDDKKLDMHDHIEEMGMYISHNLDSHAPEQHKLLRIKDEIIKKDEGMIVSPEFLVPYPLDLTIVRKLLSLSDGNFGVTDSNGNSMFKVKAKLLSLRGRRILLNASGNPVLSFQKKLISLHNRWVVFRGDSSDSKDIIFSVKEPSLIQFKTSVDLDVFLVGNEHGKCNFKVKGSWFDRCCTIYAGDGTTIVAQMHKHHTFQSIVVGKDTFKVTVYPNVDYAFIVALVAILHEINEEYDADKSA